MLLFDTLTLRSPTTPARPPRRPGFRLAAAVAAVAATAAVLLGACASAPPPTDPHTLFDDGLFRAPAVRPDAAAVFALDAAMQRYLEGPIARKANQVGAQRALFDALYAGGTELRVDFDASATRTAAETFAARSGNCLSLVVMTAAFAKALGMTVSYQSPVAEEVWSRRSGFTIRNGHVNVTLGPRRIVFPQRTPTSELMIDFVPSEQLRGLHMRPVTEATLVAMYMNNRAVEALTSDRLDDAYWWAREAVLQDAGFSGALNTLGVVYLRREAPMQAERALRLALAQDGRNTLVLANLAQTLERRGRPDDARLVRQQLAALEPNPAYEFFDRGLAAARDGDWALAQQMFAREAARPNYDPEVNHWLGVAEYRLGHVDEASRQLKQAVQGGATPADRARYAAKLEWLRNLH
ncbi:MAG: hypothetical protein ABIX12_10715 [Rubrivivax sp.]